MRIASVAGVEAKLSGYIKESQQGPVVVTKNGKPIALVLSVTDEEEIERLTLAYSPKFQEVLQVSRCVLCLQTQCGHRDHHQRS